MLKAVPQYILHQLHVFLLVKTSRGYSVFVMSNNYVLCCYKIIDVFEDISKNIKKGKPEESEVGSCLFCVLQNFSFFL